jgi:hypothetical protein
MAGITFTGRNTAGSFQRLSAALMKAALPRIERSAEITTQDAQDGILANIAADFGERKGKARSEPLATRSNYECDWDTRPTGVVMRFSVKGSPGFMAKWGALNFGSGEHQIPRSGMPAGRNGRPFIGTVESDMRSSTSVTHPGTTGTRFWNRAIEDALRGFRNRL